MTLHLTFDLPPTTNNAYTNGRNGRRILTNDARAYKDRAALIARNVASLHGWRYEPKQRLCVTLRLHFVDRRRDLGNCEKLLMDAIASALGFDDRVVDTLTLQRGEIDKAHPRCEVFLHVADIEA